jgi:hypothetical protein
MEKTGFIQENFDDYLATKAMSSGQLVRLSRSAHEYEYFQKWPTVETQSMSLGKMLHYFILEPDKFTERYAVSPVAEDYPKALKTADHLKEKCKQYGLKASGTKQQMMEALRAKDSELEFWDEILEHYAKGDRILLSKTEYQMLIGLENSIRKHSMLKKILADGIPELSGYWVDSEYKIDCKMRADWVTEKGYIVDLKTTTSGDLRSWGRKLVDYRYDIQAAWYSRGFEQIKGYKPKGFIHFIVETKPPYNIFTYLADNTVLECGETGGSDSLGYRQALDSYMNCQKTGFWPMLQTELEIESMPNYFI